MNNSKTAGIDIKAELTGNITEEVIRKKIYFFNPNQVEGLPNGPQQIKMIISLKPIVRLTSNQAVNLSLSIVYRSI